jgi:hypothetical protein
LPLARKAKERGVIRRQLFSGVITAPGYTCACELRASIGGYIGIWPMDKA